MAIHNTAWEEQAEHTPVHGFAECLSVYPYPSPPCQLSLSVSPAEWGPLAPIYIYDLLHISPAALVLLPTTAATLPSASTPSSSPSLHFPLPLQIYHKTCSAPSLLGDVMRLLCLHRRKGTETNAGRSGGRAWMKSFTLFTNIQAQKCKNPILSSPCSNHTIQEQQFLWPRLIALFCRSLCQSFG